MRCHPSRPGGAGGAGRHGGDCNIRRFRRFLGIIKPAIAHSITPGRRFGVRLDLRDISLESRISKTSFARERGDSEAGRACGRGFLNCVRSQLAAAASTAKFLEPPASARGSNSSPVLMNGRLGGKLPFGKIACVT